MSKMLYKYRGVENLERTLDIIVKGRLYAAQFTDLNDPMEGVYLYDEQVVTPAERERIKREKLGYRLVSLSKTYASTLMWSYYAEGHTGIVVGVALLSSPPDIILVDVDYDAPWRISNAGSLEATEILRRKYKLWAHERESRVFIPKRQKFISVEVKEIIFGVATSSATKKIIGAVQEKFQPNAQLRDLKAEELEGLDSRSVSSANPGPQADG
jgi:hypothetical protein